MKRIIYVLIFIFLIGFIVMSKSYGAEICNIDFELEPKAEEIKDEVDIVISANNITEKIVGISFILNYDQDIFDISEVTASDGWSALPRAENSFTIYTKDYKSTDKNGNIIKIKLKLKEDVELNNFDVQLTNIKVIKDDASEEKISEIKKSININRESNNSEVEQTDSQIYEVDTKKSNVWIYIIFAIILVLFLALICKIFYNNKKSEN